MNKTVQGRPIKVSNFGAISMSSMYILRWVNSWLNKVLKCRLLSEKWAGSKESKGDITVTVRPTIWLYIHYTDGYFICTWNIQKRLFIVYAVIVHRTNISYSNEVPSASMYNHIQLYLPSIPHSLDGTLYEWYPSIVIYVYCWIFYRNYILPCRVNRLLINSDGI